MDESVSYSVAELANWIGGTIRGDGTKAIHGVAPLAEATDDQITFAIGDKNIQKLQNSSAGAVILHTSAAAVSIPSIHVDDPLSAVLKIAQRLRPQFAEPKPGIDRLACVDPSAKIGEDCHIGPYAIVEAGVRLGRGCIIMAHAVVRSGCTLGDHVELNSHVVLYPGTIVGDRCIVHSGTVIGSDGFGYRRGADGYIKLPQLGSVEVGSDVEIGANSTIDRGMIGPTRIGAGTKIDNQVHIAHNCQVGKRNIFAGQAALAGSCVTGDDVTFAGKASAADHVTFGNGSTLGAMSGTFRDVPAGEAHIGIPARHERETLRLQLEWEKLPSLRKQVKEIAKRLGIETPNASERKAG